MAGRVDMKAVISISPRTIHYLAPRLPILPAKTDRAPLSCVRPCTRGATALHLLKTSSSLDGLKTTRSTPEIKYGPKLEISDQIYVSCPVFATYETSLGFEWAVNK